MGDDRLAQAKKEAEVLQATLKQTAEGLQDTNLAKFTADVPALPNVSMKLRRTLKGHLGKIYAMQWSQEALTLASASQDGKILVWNAVTCLKMHAIPLPSTWVMTCGYSGSGAMVASGGLDNNCTVWNLRNNPTKPLRELTGHGGFLSCCRFLDDKQILTSSGDHACFLWDIEQAQRVQEFRRHEGDVMFVSLNGDKSSFVSGSLDKCVHVWDMKSGKPTHAFYGHEGDVNVVQYFPSSTAVVSASDDGTCRLWDLRSWGELNRYVMEAPNGHAQATSVGVSKSGRYLFVSYADLPQNVVIWDSLKAERKGAIGSKEGHEKRVTSIGISGDGTSLCTASWDTSLKVWTSQSS